MNKKILLVTSEFPPGPGGIGHHAWFLSKELQKLNDVEIEVLCPKDYVSENEVHHFDSISPILIHRFKRVKGFTYFLRLFKLIELLTTNGYTHFWSSGKFALWLIWIQKIFSPKLKTLCILHGSEVNLKNIFLRKWTHVSINNFEIIVAVSFFTKNLLPNWILKTHKNIIVIPNGIDLSTFVNSKNYKLIGKPSLLTVGHVTPRKGQHRLIQALPKILEKFPDVHYHIVGRPIDELKLNILAKKLNVRKHITFHGVVKEHKDLWSLYFGSDIFVLLSENQPNGDVEGFGIVALEANLCGIPVIGAKFCGVEEAVNHLKSGYLVDGSDFQDVLEGIDFCYKHKNSLKYSSTYWAQQHDWLIIAKQFLAWI